MYINGLNGYLSKYEGTEVDAAVERVQGLDAELSLKVDKTTTINGIPLDNDIVLTAEDIGSVPAGTGYGRSLLWENSILHLKDQNGRTLSSEYIEIDLGRWGHIIGNLNDQTDLKNALDSKQPMITSEALLGADLVDDTSSVHKFATAAQLTQIGTNTTDIATNAGDIAAINAKIPEQASAQNQLADKNFVNSSIGTNTANFIGTFNSLADLEAYSGPLTNNDYAFVITTDSSGNTAYARYKYNAASDEWVYEYTLNNSSFTAAQWAAINSGATTTNIGQISTNTGAIASINTTLGGFGDIVTHNVNEFLTGVTISNPTDGQYLIFDGTSQTWKNESTVSLAWGNITGDIADQTDLQQALDDKSSVTIRDWSVS